VSLGFEAPAGSAPVGGVCTVEAQIGNRPIAVEGGRFELLIRQATPRLVVPREVVRLRAGEPEVRNLDVRGLQAGGTTPLVIDGDDLGLRRNRSLFLFVHRFPQGR